MCDASCMCSKILHMFANLSPFMMFLQNYVLYIHPSYEKNVTSIQKCFSGAAVFLQIGNQSSWFSEGSWNSFWNFNVFGLFCTWLYSYPVYIISKDSSAVAWPNSCGSNSVVHIRNNTKLVKLKKTKYSKLDERNVDVDTSKMLETWL